MKKTKLFVTALMLTGVAPLATSCTFTKRVMTDVQKGNIEALTSITLLESTIQQNEVLAKRRMMQTAPVYDEKDLEQILPTLDALLTNGSAINSTVEEVETTIDSTVYQYKETLSFKDHNLEDASYVLVYNQTDFKETTDEEDNEIETFKKLDGLVVLDENIRYSFTAVEEAEKEEDESEFERSFRIAIDDQSFILVQEENEVEQNENETEFSYLYVKNGVKELEYSISIENKNDRPSEISYELNGVEYEMKKVTVDGEERYKIEIENDKDQEAIAYYKKEIAEDGTVRFVKVA